MLSLGGWSDPVPAQVLKGLRVVLINRPGGIGQFTIDIAALLGASDEQIDALFDLESETSSFDVGLQSVNATFCSDWDSPPINLPLLAQAGYDAALLSDDDCILSLGVNASTDEIMGCTPIAQPAPFPVTLAPIGLAPAPTTPTSQVTPAPSSPTAPASQMTPVPSPLRPKPVANNGIAAHHTGCFCR